MRADVCVCVPVLRRYDLLGELLASLRDSTVMPVAAFVIDNGRQEARITAALVDSPIRVAVLTPSVPMGVAESWNWFIDNVPQERLITNDDVTFGRRSIEAMVSTPGDMVSATPGRAFSCFVLRDSCVRIVGRFDQSISPGYAYFEDCDYEQRMRDAGTYFTYCECGVNHVESATVKQLTDAERSDHDSRFIVAQENYLKKWGRLPEGIVRQMR